MFEFTLGIGEVATIHGHYVRVVKVEIVPYRHHYRCWLCKCEGILEFEPDALEPSWTECHYCGLHNEISPGLYDRPALIPGHVPTRIV